MSNYLCICAGSPTPGSITWGDSTLVCNACRRKKGKHTRKKTTSLPRDAELERLGRTPKKMVRVIDGVEREVWACRRGSVALFYYNRSSARAGKGNHRVGEHGLLDIDRV